MSLEGVDFFSNQYYVHIRRLLSIIALWPFEESSKRLPYISLITILMIVGINSQACLLLTSKGKMETITELLQTLLPTCAFAIAYWNLLYNSAVIKETLEHVRNDWNELTCEDELSIMQTYAAQSKICAQSIACAFFFYTAFLIFPSIIRFFLFIFGAIDKSKLILPVYDEFFVESKLSYYLSFSLEIIIISILYVIGITNYTIFISLLQHACALFIIVTNKIERPFKESEYEMGWMQTVTNCKRETEFEWIVGVVNYYNKAIKFVNLITLLYGKMYIVEVVLGFCFIIIDFIYLFQLLSFMMTFSEALKISLYLIGTMVLICAYSHVMQRLIDHSDDVYAKCRLISFYKLSIKTNKILLQLITQTMKSCSFSIKGIIVASHEVLVTVFKTSFSFATVCYKMH